jgi:nucleoside-diphosphate-sugar epimerase
MKILVTGGGGFLGSALVKKLIERGYQVSVLNRKRYSELEKIGAASITADISDASRVANACAGMDAVFHTAAKAGFWGDYNEYYAANVTGTKNIIDGCRKGGVEKLIYTSSPSVAYNAEEALNMDESAPYPAKYLCYYSQTKAEAERMVIAASGKDGGLLTVSLRPHLIWGPGDNHLIPRVIKAAAEKSALKRLKIVGSGLNKVDITYIDNAVEAHLNAFDALAPGAKCAGAVYFISQGEPVVLWDFINRILRGVNIAPLEKKVSFNFAYSAGMFFEALYGLFKIKSEPRMTRFLAAQLSKSHYFNISRAKNEIGYKPIVFTEEGLVKLIESLNNYDGPQR